MTTETSKIEMQRENKNMKDKQDIQELWEKFKSCNICVWKIPEGGGRKKRNRRDIWSNDWEFSKINEKYQTVDLGSSENTKKDKYKKKLMWAYYIQTAKNQRQKKKKSWKKPEEKTPVEEEG